MGKGSDAPSGVQLMDLIKNRIDEILMRESTNHSGIYLYRTGDYWVAFEKSAYRLEAVCRDVSVMPVKIARIPAPFLMTSIEGKRLQALAGRWECAGSKPAEKFYEVPGTVDATAYRAWHDRKSEPVTRAMKNGLIPH